MVVKQIYVKSYLCLEVLVTVCVSLGGGWWGVPLRQICHRYSWWDQALLTAGSELPIDEKLNWVRLWRIILCKNQTVTLKVYFLYPKWGIHLICWCNSTGIKRMMLILCFYWVSKVSQRLQIHPEVKLMQWSKVNIHQIWLTVFVRTHITFAHRNVVLKLFLSFVMQTL